MYEEMSQKDLSQLFLEYYQQDWKKRSEAARILGYINDEEEINRLTPYIMELALDTNRFIRINLAHSIKKIVLEHNIINEDIFVLLYLWANSPIAILSEMARRIISSLDIHIVSRYILSLSLKLYSSEPIKVMYALFSMGLISTINPEYTTNTLPEIMAIATGHRYKLIQLLAIEILEEFVNMKKEHLVSTFVYVYRLYVYLQYKKEKPQFKRGSIEYILYKYFKKQLTKEEIEDLIYDLTQSQTPGKKIILLLLYTHFKPLRELLDENETLSKTVLQEVLQQIKNDNFMIKLSAILLFSKIVTVENVYQHLSKRDIDEFFKVIEDNLTEGNYLLKGTSLEALCNLMKWGNSQYILEKIEEIMDKIDIESIMNEGYLCYYNGVCVLLKLNKCPSTKSSPYFDIDTIKEISSLGIDDYRYLILDIITSVRRSVWISGWLDRFYSGKYLGNLLHIKPEYSVNVLDTIKYLIRDNYFIVRNLGAWILRTVAQLDTSFPEDFIIDTFILFDDRFPQGRLEYMLFWKTVLERSPHLFDNENICREMAYEMIAKYLNDRHVILRETYLNILEESGITEKYPTLKYFKDFHSISEEEKKELFKKYWGCKELRKAIAVAIKWKLKEYIKNKKYNAIREYLDMISHMEIHREIFYMLYELILLKHMGFKEVEKIINNIKNKHLTIPYYLEEKLFFNINEPLIVVRYYKLKRLLAMIKEGFYISYNLINKVKETAIYEHICGKNAEMALKILSNIEDDESKAIVKEELELKEYMEKKSILEIKYKKLENMDWKDIYLIIEYLPTEGKLIIPDHFDLEDFLNKAMDILENEDKVTVKIKIIDYFINEIHENERLLNMLLGNKDLFKILYNLCSDNNHLLFKRVMILLEELASLEEGWLERNIIEYYKEGWDNKKPLRYLLYMLYEDIPLYFKLDILRAVREIIKDRVEQCKKLCREIRKMLEEGKISKEEILSKYREIVGIYTITSPYNILCQNMDNVAFIVNAIFSGDIKKQPWDIIKSTLDILLLMCKYVLLDEKIISTVLKKLLEYYEVLKDEEIAYLYLYIRRLLERSNFNIEKLGEEYLRRYKKLERRVVI